MAAWRLSFFSLSHLKTWLGGHPKGMEVLNEAMATRCDLCTRVLRQPMLVLLASDGWVEVYGDWEDVTVVVANKLETTAPETERLAEDYLDMTLPRKGRAVYSPGNLLAVGQVERRTAADESERRHRVAWLAALREVPNGD